MIFFSLALLVAAVLLAVAHVSAARGRSLSTVFTAGIAVFVVVVGVATIVQVYRIGDSGRRPPGAKEPDSQRFQRRPTLVSRAE